MTQRPLNLVSARSAVILCTLTKHPLVKRVFGVDRELCFAGVRCVRAGAGVARDAEDAEDDGEEQEANTSGGAGDCGEWRLCKTERNNSSFLRLEPEPSGVRTKS